MKFLRKCDCGGEPDLVHSFSVFFVECIECGASTKSFPVSTKVNGAWPKDAAAQAWNDRVLEDV
jgi:hypothetical protein